MPVEKFGGTEISFWSGSSQENPFCVDFRLDESRPLVECFIRTSGILVINWLQEALTPNHICYEGYGEPLGMVQGAIDTRNPLPLLDYLIEQDYHPDMTAFLLQVAQQVSATN